MYAPTAAFNRQMHSLSATSGLWLRSRRWDLCCLTGSSILVVFPLVLYALVGQAALVVNLVIAGLIGGPHMYATFLRTFLDASFWREHRFFALSSCSIPVLVVVCALWHFPLLLTLFFFWASIHVLHQIAYLLECYARKQPRPPQPWARYIDYAVVFSCLYPLATYHFIYDEFAIGKTTLLYPAFLKTPVLYYAILGFFSLALCLFIGKTLREIQQGTAHYPRIFLIGTTVSLALFITSYSGHRLEIAFQGFNTWHSFQYLALSWAIYAQRQQRGAGPSLLPRISRHAGRRWRSFYGITAALTGGSLLLIGLLYNLSGFTFEESYYVVVLSCLLIHYYHDHLLFTRFDDLLVWQQPAAASQAISPAPGVPGSA